MTKENKTVRATETNDDVTLFDVLAKNSWDLRCISVPTGGDDYDIDWIVIEHHMAEPQEREVGRAYRDDPRLAIRRAIRQADPKAERCVGCDEVLHDGDSVYYEHGEGGHLHSWCASDDPESFVDEDEVPLKAGDDIPEPFAYQACDESPSPPANVVGSDPLDIERQADYLYACADVIMESSACGKLEAKVAMERAARKLVSLSAELRMLQGNRHVINQLYEILGAHDDDDIREVAKARMSEIASAEEQHRCHFCDTPVDPEKTEHWVQDAYPCCDACASAEVEG